MQQSEDRVNSQELTIGIVKLFNIFAGTRYTQKLKNQHQLWKEIISLNIPLFVEFLRQIQDIPEFQAFRTRFKYDILKHKQNWIKDLEEGKQLYRLRDQPRNEKHYNINRSRNRNRNQ